ncbi:hypothetical protein SDRG_13892 [Saprolegnia diclina VS20]|uniref:Armadillo repeat-containing domain-containing protein n=1 Tax=Saprolegnia diclina (strain VS20) TaxID=1156394 RepID=T0Q4I3_SAPDV|nr:hypothetical protein SDRG_13892 [Saprolegnia diclina VS20]EQC28345.1 hypothetical protein SDRG_13892 [Saprolegnia diclina VS20]|eukprot:XP_008618215.1 hypothetical protein SDRG_13892 [Saprolegnia diclina VS20]
MATKQAKKQITQETFNDCVRENMDEFEMDEDEAVDDAIKQFESQGVDLSSIVKALTTSVVHPVVVALESLRALAADADVVALDQALPHYTILLTHFRAADAAAATSAKEMAGRNDGTTVLLGLLQGSVDHSMQMQTLVVLHAMVNGVKDNQDFVGVDGILQLQALAAPTAATPVQNAALAALKTICAKHESNKKHLNPAGIRLLMSLLETRKESTDTKHIGDLIRTLTINDDPTAMFSQAHDIVKLFVDESLIPMTFEHISVVASDADTVAVWLAVLKQLAVTEDNCRKIVDSGALDLVPNLQATHAKHRGVIKHSLGLLRNIAGVDEYKHVVTTMVPSILATMQEHASDVGIQTMACATIAAVCLRSPVNCQKVVSLRAHVWVATAMASFPGLPSLLRQASLALRNMVVRNEELRPLVLEEPLVELMLRHAMPLRGCGDEAYAALRDLGCDIPLAAITQQGSCNFNPTMDTSNMLQSSVAANARAPFPM